MSELRCTTGVVRLSSKSTDSSPDDDGGGVSVNVSTTVVDVSLDTSAVAGMSLGEGGSDQMMDYYKL